MNEDAAWRRTGRPARPSRRRRRGHAGVELAAAPPQLLYSLDNAGARGTIYVCASASFEQNDHRE